MREIKFRAWHPLAQKMATIDALDFMLDSYRAHAGKSSGSGHLADIELMQYTGLTDRQGKEIYEGDIVKSETDTFHGAVFFENGCFWVRECMSHVDEGLYDDREKETRWSINLNWDIIGNVYEDPELTGEYIGQI